MANQDFLTGKVHKGKTYIPDGAGVFHELLLPSMKLSNSPAADDIQIALGGRVQKIVPPAPKEMKPGVLDDAIKKVQESQKANPAPPPKGTEKIPGRQYRNKLGNNTPGAQSKPLSERSFLERIKISKELSSSERILASLKSLFTGEDPIEVALKQRQKDRELKDESFSKNYGKKRHAGGYEAPETRQEVLQRRRVERVPGESVNTGSEGVLVKIEKNTLGGNKFLKQILDYFNGKKDTDKTAGDFTEEKAEEEKEYQKKLLETMAGKKDKAITATAIPTKNDDDLLEWLGIDALLGGKLIGKFKGFIGVLVGTIAPLAAGVTALIAANLLLTRWLDGDPKIMESKHKIDPKATEEDLKGLTPGEVLGQRLIRDGIEGTKSLFGMGAQASVNKSYGKKTVFPAGKNVDSLLPIFRKLEGSGDSAVSPAGAIGRYQIMPKTAKQYGFDPTKLKDPQYNEMAARAILSDLSQKYNGDIDAIAVAYNGGPGRAKKWLAANRNPSALHKETQNYLEHLHKIVGPTSAKNISPTARKEGGVIHNMSAKATTPTSQPIIVNNVTNNTTGKGGNQKSIGSIASARNEENSYNKAQLLNALSGVA